MYGLQVWLLGVGYRILKGSRYSPAQPSCLNSFSFQLQILSPHSLAKDELEFGLLSSSVRLLLHSIITFPKIASRSKTLASKGSVPTFLPELKHVFFVCRIFVPLFCKPAMATAVQIRKLAALVYYLKCLAYPIMYSRRTRSSILYNKNSTVESGLGYYFEKIQFSQHRMECIRTFESASKALMSSSLPHRL